MKFSMRRLALGGVLSLTVLLTACGGMDEPYKTASGTSVYRVEWVGDIGYVTDANGDDVGKIHAEDMRGWNGYSVYGTPLRGFMYYNYSGNRLYEEDSGGGVGRAINNAAAARGSDSNWAAQAAESRKEKIAMFAEGLQHKYALPKEKAGVVASALQAYHETQVERGFSTAKDVEDSFQKVFGVEYNTALTAAKAFQDGKPQQIRDLTNRSAAYLGIKPDQAQKFIKSMYRETLKQNGYDPDTLSW